MQNKQQGCNISGISQKQLANNSHRNLLAHGEKIKRSCLQEQAGSGRQEGRVPVCRCWPRASHFLSTVFLHLSNGLPHYRTRELRCLLAELFRENSEGALIAGGGGRFGEEFA